MKNSNGQPSASLTMALVSFILVTAWLVFWVVGTTFGLHVPEFAAGDAMAYMTPLLTLYFGRRWTEKDLVNPNQPNQEVVEESSSETDEEVEEEETQPEAQEQPSTSSTTTKRKSNKS